MIDLLLLLLLMVGGTWLIGWWAILLLAATWGWWRGWSRSAVLPAIAGALTWGGWLAFSGPTLTLFRLADKLGDVFSAPAPMLLALPPLFAALLGWSAARLMQSLRRSTFETSH